jgi:hypothetical protein
MEFSAVKRRFVFWMVEVHALLSTLAANSVLYRFIVLEETSISVGISTWKPRSSNDFLFFSETKAAISLVPRV